MKKILAIFILMIIIPVNIYALNVTNVTCSFEETFDMDNHSIVVTFKTNNGEMLNYVLTKDNNFQMEIPYSNLTYVTSLVEGDYKNEYRISLKKKEDNNVVLYVESIKRTTTKQVTTTTTLTTTTINSSSTKEVNGVTSKTNKSEENNVFKEHFIKMLIIVFSSIFLILLIYVCIKIATSNK